MIFQLPVPTIAYGKARTPLPAISPARNTPAVITPNPEHMLIIRFLPNKLICIEDVKMNKDIVLVPITH